MIVAGPIHSVRFQLPYSLDWQTLKSKFASVGEIRFAEISKNDKGRSNGWGLVSFRREEDALVAVRKLACLLVVQ